MTCYIVTFEPLSEASCLKIKQQLKTYPHYCPIHKYCWAIMSDKKSKDIRDDLGKIVQPGERLFVIRSGTEAAWRNSYGEKNNEWLKKNL
jgi:hypothetical protein